MKEYLENVRENFREVAETCLDMGVDANVVREFLENAEKYGSSVFKGYNE